MSLAATIKAYAAKCDPVAKLALIEIADWADDAGRAPIVVSQIAEFAGCSEIDAERAIVRLVDSGIISIMSPDGRGRRIAVFAELRQ